MEGKFLIVYIRFSSPHRKPDCDNGLKGIGWVGNRPRRGSSVDGIQIRDSGKTVSHCVSEANLPYDGILRLLPSSGQTGEDMGTGEAPTGEAAVERTCVTTPASPWSLCAVCNGGVSRAPLEWKQTASFSIQRREEDVAQEYAGSSSSWRCLSRPDEAKLLPVTILSCSTGNLAIEPKSGGVCAAFVAAEGAGESTARLAKWFERLSRRGYWVSSKLLLGIWKTTSSSCDLCLVVENEKDHMEVEGFHGAVSWRVALNEVRHLDRAKEISMNLQSKVSISSSPFKQQMSSLRQVMIAAFLPNNFESKSFVGFWLLSWTLIWTHRCWGWQIWLWKYITFSKHWSIWENRVLYSFPWYHS